MMRVLVVKTSSMGDIIHTLPALTDAKKIFPDISFDWVCEESFKEVPAWHSAVNRVIPIALRRWRKQKKRAFQQGEIKRFLADLRRDEYDYIIDAQGLLKSVVVTLASRGKKRVGLSWQSARESLASLFYQKRAVVPWEQHAVHRARSLFAQALGYALPETTANYGIDRKRLPTLSLAGPYFVFLHGTTWATKHWPEAYWCELAKTAAASGFKIQLLWGNDIELARAKKIAETTPEAFVMPNRLSLSEAASVLADARGIVSVDTGLGHLAAALSIPTVALYGPTNPKLSGTLGENQLFLSTEFPCSPCMSRTCLVAGDKPVDPPCFATLPPDKVWQSLLLQINV